MGIPGRLPEWPRRGRRGGFSGGQADGCDRCSRRHNRAREEARRRPVQSQWGALQSQRCHGAPKPRPRLGASHSSHGAFKVIIPYLERNQVGSRGDRSVKNEQRGDKEASLTMESGVDNAVCLSDAARTKEPLLRSGPWVSGLLLFWYRLP